MIGVAECQDLATELREPSTSSKTSIHGKCVDLSPKLIIVEGNIGVGKSTLAKEIADDLNFKLFLEPSTENPYLEKFYVEPKKYALSLQLWIFQQRCNTYRSAVKHILFTGQGVVLDRSAYSDSVFARVCTDQGYISEQGYEEYESIRREAMKHFPAPHVTIYLDATPEQCFSRIQNRGRVCETGISLDYLSKVHDEYLKFINHMSQVGGSILHYDWSDFKNVKSEYVSRDIQQCNSPTWSPHVLYKLT